MPELVIKFVGTSEAQRLRERGYQVVAGEMGDVLIHLPCVELADTVELDLRSFLGIKEITARGIGRLW